ncbi:MAG: hypothetical protein GWP06_12490 [Actinobacteria bacterium]|nr:hypothetical protein [Actinomycetota bacterium]
MEAQKSSVILLTDGESKRIIGMVARDPHIKAQVFFKCEEYDEDGILGLLNNKTVEIEPDQEQMNKIRGESIEEYDTK